MANAPVAVDIVDAVPTAVRVRANELRIGDKVFTPTGQRIKLVRVNVYVSVVTTVREDGWKDSFRTNETITILR